MMIRNLILSLTLASALACTWLAPTAAAAATFDRYVGVLHHSQADRDQYAKLDFITDREADGQLLLSAVLTLYFGDFASKEYISYHFNGVRYNLVTGALVFDEPDQDVTVRSTTFRGGRFEGDIRSTLNGMVGTLELSQDGSIAATKPLIKPIWGEYRGTCDEQDTYLQLNSFRRAGLSSDDGTSPFRSYEINGQYGRVDERLCPNAQSLPCVTIKIHAGSYNFFKEHLELAGRQHRLSCEVTETGLVCGACTLNRISNEMTGTLTTSPRRSMNHLLSDSAEPSVNPAVTAPSASLEGEYYGYLHHEFLDAYQPAQLNILSFQDPDGSGSTLKLSASARLFFGDFGSNEVLTYRFDQRLFNIINPQLVFQRPGADLDATLQVTSLGSGKVRGVWYSRMFGRVGTFELVKGTPPALDASMKKIGAISGKYESSDIELTLRAQLGAGTPNTENPFNPLEFSGGIWHKSGIARRIDISEGTYDFYTGRMSLRTADDDRVAVGEADLTAPTLYVKLPAKVFGALMQPHSLAKFDPMPLTALRNSANVGLGAIHTYKLENLPETETTCADAALRWAAELSRVTGVSIVTQACERPVDFIRYGMNVIISYTAARALPPGTTAEDFTYGNSATYEDCLASVAEEVLTFKAKTGLDVFAAYCTPAGYLNIRSFGTSPIVRRVFEQDFAGHQIDDVYIADTSELLARFTDAIDGLGTTVVKSVVRGNHAYIYYYAHKTYWLEILGETGYLNEADCEAQKTHVSRHLSSFGHEPLVQYCAPTSRHPEPKRSLFTLSYLKSNVDYGQIRYLYQERIPGTFASLADCDAARPGVEAHYVSQGYTVYSSWCTVAERSSTYSIDLFRRR